MVQYGKIIYALLCCCHLILISCKSNQKPDVKIIPPVNYSHDPVFNKFIHSFIDTLPAPVNYVSDFENIFTAEQEVSINNIINNFENETTNQVAVVTFDTAMVTRNNFEALILKLGNAWGVGQKEKNNGMVIGISAGHKKIYIRNGRGITKILSDSTTKQIIDSSFIPYFKQSDYYSATVTGLNSIIQKLSKAN